MKWTSRLTWLLISGLAVITASVLGSVKVPLYDGVGFPDQPYIYSVKSGPAILPASSAEKIVTQTDAANGTALLTPETGPQLNVVFSPTAIQLPPGVTETKLTGVPKAPTDSPPSGAIASNVYEVTAASINGTPTIRPAFAEIYLRLPQKVTSKTPPVIVYRQKAGMWKILPTVQTGTDIYVATFSNWGEYALAINTRPTSSPSNLTNQKTVTKHTGLSKKIIIAAIFIGLLILIIVVIRYGSSKNHRETKR